jgi:STE24 endopeptidase
VSPPPTTACDRAATDVVDPAPVRQPHRHPRRALHTRPRRALHTGPRRALHTGPRRADVGTSAAAVASGAVVLLCVVGRVPEHLLQATGVQGWAPGLVAVMAVVNSARAIAQAPFTFARRQTSAAQWATDQVTALGGTVVVGSILTLPLYGLIRSSSRWWLWAWAMFAGVTVVSQAAMPLLMKVRAGALVPAPAVLAERVRAIATNSGVDIDGDVLVAGKAKGKSRRCNAYVVGMGPSRRVILESGVAAWPPQLIDQVVAHEIGHWRLGHAARRLPLTIAAQLVTFGLAAAVLSFPPLLGWAGISGAGDPRSYPLLLAITAIVVLPARLCLAWYDRSQERAADRFARAVLGTPDDFVAMLDRAALEGDAPRRLPWWRKVTASHPPIDERIQACRP